ncbi:H-type small acid-soluble spore protein [Sutcliffiella horikoshii]|uniref:H-type small acid-soluble spore protein n=1 Tax=Sutcliffiella horikoshii TaxID=79883 RepID=A0A1Y0CSC0_9BACI|nr:H-type small acid-soluble spore protein [Sutcliffiella horikoshii]ART77797.1 H-type small acid-soluble spore protein [Sutcliffiella horikoshii]TYS60254.1 H-type small acid-soluble spore protein [Sutcliffiella horikoshii]
MDETRARQILSSSATIEVTFEGTKVWIDSLSEDGKTATIHLRGPGEERTQVAVSDLIELGE